MPDAATSLSHRLPVVLVPGLLCDARLWSAVRARLQGASVTVSLVHAGSLEAMADAILAAAPPRCVLAGFSMGGMAAVLAAARAPARFAAVAICATHAEPDTEARAAFRREQIAAAESGDFATLAAGLPALYLVDPANAAPSARLIIAMAEAQGPAIFARHVRAILNRPDLAAVARRIVIPTHIACGADDRIAPPDLARRLAALVRDATLTVIAACGHMLPLEAPDAMAAFLNTLACPSEWPGAT